MLRIILGVDTMHMKYETGIARLAVTNASTRASQGPAVAHHVLHHPGALAKFSAAAFTGTGTSIRTALPVLAKFSTRTLEYRY